ncbi:MAG TPA: MlaD family protein [Candidatus Eisenbacteria bacterium]|nr:MlaD family protein [Candidatus Eisenbacteria bacterium]
MKRTGRVPFMKLQIGLAALAAIVLLLWATLQSGAFRIGPEESIVLSFASAGGLETGSSVRLNGVLVGAVRELKLESSTNRVTVTLGVAKGTRGRLHQGASARITTVGFLADLYVALESGDESKPVIAGDSEISTVLASDPQQIMGRAVGIADSLNMLVASLNKAGKRLADGRGTLGRLSEDERLYESMVEMTRNANELTQRLTETQAKVSERMLSVATSLDSLTWRLQHGEGTAAQLITNGELHSRLVSVSGRLDSVLTVVESGRGNVGRLMADSTLYEDTRELVSSMKRLMAEIEKNPKKYMKFSIF